jgi:hypothetical protein
MKRIRARNLDDEDIGDIVALLDSWSGRLSWELLIEAVEKRKFARYTRQALHRHERIRYAFSVRKQAITRNTGAGSAQVTSPELRAALERIARLEGENARLTAENHRLLEQFVCWAYNAHTRGLDKDFLSRPLPAVNRDQTPRLGIKHSRVRHPPR